MDNGDFARLFPRNPLARIAFDEVVEKLRRDGATPYAHRFLVYEKAKDDLSSESGSETRTNALKPQAINWTGYYRLNNGIPPKSRSLGWVMGSGRQDDLGEAGVDFLLTSRSKAYRVRGRHARLVHNLSTGILMIQTDYNRRVLLDGKLSIQGGKQAITTTSTGIILGDLAYSLVFTNLNEDVYKAQLSALRTEVGMTDSEPPPSLGPIPSATHYDIMGYTVQGVFAEGSTCTVAAGIKKDEGSAVAVKRMKRNKHNFDSIQKEIDVLRRIGQHPRVCCLVEDLFSGGSDKAAGRHQIDEVHLIYSPLAMKSFFDVIESDLSDDHRAVLVKQSLQGIAYIHQQGIMHRDIKPRNMALTSEHKPRAIIIDFGLASWDERSIDHRVGTIAYLAPEVMELKTGQGSQSYDKTIDIWALGLSALELFMRQHTSHKPIDRVRYDTFTRALDSDPSKSVPLHRLLGRMLQWEPTQRISASGALLDPALCAVDAEEAPHQSLNQKSTAK
ncbi:MAG: hypothetical protein M1817_000678 [Caeruleum heppii]|nr:MAG: hypothetical protein M1817_000678 [Caeruleum heppii]